MNNNDIKIAAAYIRVSSDKQTELSPASQIKTIQQFAKAHGYIVPKEFLYRDDGITGAHANKRPEFVKMIAEAKQKNPPFTAILVWKFSRFARNQEESIVYKSLLEKNGVQVISVSEPLTDDPFGKLIERIIEWEDEYYLIRLAGETKRGMKEKVERGKPVSIPPFGYIMKNKNFVIDEEKAVYVRKIFSDFLNGVPVQTIARNMNAIGIKTNRGNVWENRTVDYILQNPVYIGKIRWNPERRTRRNYNDDSIMLVDGTHQPIIDEETFKLAQEKIALNKKKYPKYSRKTIPGSKSDYMLHGLVKCSNCGSTLSASNKGLQCIKYTHAKGCNVSHYISLDKLNELVIKSIEVAFQTGMFNIEIKNNVQNEEHINYAFIIKREKNKLERVKEAYEDGVYNLQEFKERKIVLENKIKELQSKEQSHIKLDVSKKRLELIKKHKSVVTMLRNKKIPENEKNELLRSFISKIIFNRPDSSVELFFYT